jgi:hypothetical protein
VRVQTTDLGETGPLSQGVQAGRKALRIHHINGMEVCKKGPRGFKKKAEGVQVSPLSPLSAAPWHRLPQLAGGAARLAAAEREAVVAGHYLVPRFLYLYCMGLNKLPEREAVNAGQRAGLAVGERRLPGNRRLVW